MPTVKPKYTLVMSILTAIAHSNKLNYPRLNQERHLNFIVKKIDINKFEKMGILILITT